MMNRIHRIAFSILFSVLISPTITSALDPNRAITQYDVTKWVQEIAPLLKNLSSSANGWNLEHLTSEISSPSDPYTPTAQI